MDQPRRANSSHPVYQINRAFYTRVLDLLPLPVFLADHNRQLLLLNHAFRDLGLQNSRGFSGRTLDELFTALSYRAEDPPALRSRLLRAWENGSSGQAVKFTLQAPQKRVFQLSLFPGLPPQSGLIARGGVVIELTSMIEEVSKSQAVLRDLLEDSRGTSLLVNAGLQSVRKHLHTWSPDFLEDVLDRTLRDGIQLDDNLDLALYYQQLDNDQGILFPEPYSFAQLIEDFFEALREKDLLPAGQNPQPGKDPSILVDPERTLWMMQTLAQQAAEDISRNMQIQIQIQDQVDDIRLRFSIDPAEDFGSGSREEKTGLPLSLQRVLWICRKIQEQQQGQLRYQWEGEEWSADWIVGFSFPGLETFSKTDLTLQDPQQLEGESQILIGSTESDTLAFLNAELQQLGYRVKQATTAAAVLDISQVVKPDLILLDREIPPLGGIQVLTSLRRWSQVPVMIMSRREDGDDLIRCLEAGADDYLPAPFRIEELAARITSQLRRISRDRNADLENQFHQRDLRINYATHQVWVRGKLVELTPLEYSILSYLSHHPGQVLTYEQILNRSWEGPEKGSRQGLFVHISRLREKVEQDPDQPYWIKNRWGVGYLFGPES